MELLLQRKPSAEKTTLGELYRDSSFECHTLEDVVRPDGVKVWGETAIPAGRYRVTITYSPKFKQEMPLVHDVPGFTGVRIHTGNTIHDTHGCVLVGEVVLSPTTIGNSRVAYNKLFLKLRAALDSGQEVWLEVRDAL
jgi:hypothetical protein